LGIPAAAIVDLDVLKEGGENWSKFMKGCNLPALDRPFFEGARAQLLRALEAKSQNFTKGGGIAVLAREDREAAQNLLSRLAEYGMFVVPVGEVEHWLPQLGQGLSKGRWLRQIFEAMGEDESDASYVRPGDDDVWSFMREVSGWLLNPMRKGLTH
jgi:hypothetical protein